LFFGTLVANKKDEIKGAKKESTMNDTMPVAGGTLEQTGGKTLFKNLGAFMGMGLIGLGAYWSMKLFFAGSKVLQGPERMAPILKTWNEFFGKDPVKILVKDVAVQLDARLLNFLALGGGAFFLLFIVANLLNAGIQLFTSSVTEASSVKKMLTAWASGYFYRQPGTPSKE